MKQTETVTGFTPGPWKRENHRITDARGFFIAGIPFAGSVDSISIHDANAALIAAAPVMFEALQAVSRLDYLNEHNALADKVRAALAQAQGKLI